MWHTSRGDRTLRGAEAALVGAAIDMMVDALLIHIDESLEDSPASECQSGVALYDSLSACQRVGLLHDVASHLLAETTDPLDLSAPVEATVAAVYAEIRDQVAIEIDLFPEERARPGRPTWRSRVLASFCSVFFHDESGSPPAVRGDETIVAGLPGEEGKGVSSVQDVPDDFVPSDFDPEEFSEDWELPEPVCVDIGRWEPLIERLCDAVLWDRDFEMAESFLDIDPGVSQHRRRLLGIDENYFSSVAPDPKPEEVDRLVSRTRDIVRAKPR